LRLDDRYFEDGFKGVSIVDSAPKPAPEPRELPPPSVPGETVGDFAAVRRADVRFSNGTGQVVYEEDDKPPLVFRVDFLRKLGIKNGDAVVVDSVGISNEPKIPDGAVVLVNRGDRERLNGDLFAFRVDGELLIKRLERIDGVGILATADNPNFKPKQKVYASAIDFEVIGRAVWTGALL
jgi:phage repressor protein C with HTH and peptisase S24 domain